MARDDLHFRLRIPEDLKRLVEEAAERNHRSMTAEIIDRLSDSFSSKPKEDKNQFEKYAEEMAKNAAIEAATRAIDIVLDAFKAPEGTSDAERFRMIVRGTKKEIQADEDRMSANPVLEEIDARERTKPKPE